MSAFSRLLTLLLLPICTGCAGAPGRSSSDANAVARFENGLMTVVAIKGRPIQRMTLASRMRYYRVPSVSIAFFDANGVLWTRAYGATPDTLFQGGSISKPVSAVGIMRLVQAHRLNLDENLNDELRSWKVPQNAFTAKHPVTLRELLSHTAGMSVHGFEGYERGKTLPTLEQVLDGKPPANSPPIRVVLTPGTEYQSREADTSSQNSWYSAPCTNRLRNSCMIRCLRRSE